MSSQNQIRRIDPMCSGSRSLAAHKARIRKAQKCVNPLCFKCSSPVDGDYEHVLIVVECQDSSYTGSFTVPWCESCKMTIRDAGNEVTRGA